MVRERIGQILAGFRRDSVVATRALPIVMIRAHYLGLSPEQAMGYHMASAGRMCLSQGTEALFGK